MLLALLIIILLAVPAFVGLYFTRFQTMNSIEQLTDYSDGYNLYRMDIKYDYNTEDLTAQIVIRRNWDGVTTYSLGDNTVKLFEFE